MAFLIGVFLALTVSLFATWVGFDRERSFYATVLIVIGALYGLFAVMGGSSHSLGQELIGTAFFVFLSVLGFKFNPWFLVAGLFGHGVFDLFHPHLITNAGVPVWWPMFCSAYDITAAGYLAVLLWRAKRHEPQ